MRPNNNKTIKTRNKMKGRLLLIVLSIFYCSFAWGLVLSKFYSWYLQPVYPVPNITYLQAVGLWLMVSLFRGNGIQFIKEDYKLSLKDSYIVAFIAPLITLFGGFIIHLTIK